MTIADIPDELKTYAQWCVWRYENRNDSQTKVPYDAKTGQLAAVDNPRTFSTFAQACEALSTGAYSGLGFILTEGDPFTFIDLDIKAGITQADLSRHISVQEKFDSYSERSPGGKGLHIICKGHVPRGRKRSGIEIYSSARYMTVTGDVFDRKPIAERQSLVQLLWSEMGVGTPIYSDVDCEQTISDDEVIGRAMAAANGAKFTGLMNAQWQELGYPSQSEADFALIDILAFYTQNREQIIRIFHLSWLGQRLKAQRTGYVDSMVNRSFDRMLPQINFDSLRQHIDEIVTGQKANGAGGTAPSVPQSLPEWSSTGGNAVSLNVPDSIVKFPPGLMGDIASFIFYASQRPVPEVSLAAAIGLMAGVCGRAYNTPTGAGLNLYTLLVASSGIGKEAMAGGISRLIESVAKLVPGESKVPSIREFVGPGEFRSDAALVKSLERTPCMVSIQGEFGLKLKKMHAMHAASHVAVLKEIYLDVFSKSGFGNVYRPIVYSDAAKNTHEIQCPAFSLLCESTPSTFYDALDESMIAHGLLPRFFTIEYLGIRVPSNATHALTVPSPQLQVQFGQLAAHCHTLMHAGTIINANFADAETAALADRFDKYCDHEINSNTNEVIRDLWNRGHLKVLKLASLVAVGLNSNAPLITVKAWEWAQELIEVDIRRMVKRFQKGDIGASMDQNEQKQQDEILRVMREFLFKPWDQIDKYKVGTPAMQTARVVPAGYINKRLIASTVFKKDRGGATVAINRTLKTLQESGIISDVTGKAKFDIGGKIYMISDMRYLKQEE